MNDKSDRPAKSAQELLERYANGERIFAHSKLKGVDLIGANLDGAVFGGADFTGARLDKVSLAKTNLIGANFQEASLREAVISPAAVGGADFFKADLEGANLFSAQLKDCHLVQANLSKCNLAQTGFDNAWFGLTTANDTVLSFTHLSEIVYAQAPEYNHPLENYVNDATVRKSAALLRPELYRDQSEDFKNWLQKQRLVLVKFFESCGITKFTLELEGLLGDIEMNLSSAFVSYASEDEEFVTKLDLSLSNAGVRTWFAPRMMKGGIPIYEQISKAIHEHDRLLLVLSKHSMNSNWVKTELLTTKDVERKSGKRMLFPIRLVPFEDLQNWVLFDGDSGLDLARYVREFYVPDFSNWQDTMSYEVALNKLLRDMRTA